MINIFVISTDDERGRLRRQSINFPHTIWTASTTPIDLIKNRWRNRSNEDTTADKYNAKLSCFTSHYLLLNHIVKNKIDNVVVCEDDVQATNIPLYPSQDITILNGRFQHPTSYAKNKDLDKNAIISELKLNTLTNLDYTKYRVSGAHAIHYPKWTQVQNIINLINNDKCLLTHYDLWLNNKKLIKYIQYPSPYLHDDRKFGSSINKNNLCSGLIINYRDIL